MGQIAKCADVAIIGGGAAGCLAAIAAKEGNPAAEVVIVEKASIRGEVPSPAAWMPSTWW